MQNSLSRKALVCGVIVLFVGVSIVPSIGGNYEIYTNSNSQTIGKTTCSFLSVIPLSMVDPEKSIRKPSSTSRIIDKSTDRELSTNRQELIFGSNLDASTLEIEGISDNYTPSFNEIEVKIQDFHFDMAECVIHPKEGKQVCIEINGLKPCGSPGAPMLPMKTFTIELPKNAELIHVDTIDVYYCEIKNSLDIIPNPEPISWSNDEIMSEQVIDTFRSNKEIYNSDKFFPGMVVSYDMGEDNVNKKVFVRVYPIQYIPKLSKAILITDGQIRVYYRIENKPLQSPTSKSTSAVNVIITPPLLFNQALELKNYHDADGTSTYVVNTTWIYSNYEEADDPPYIGYSDPDLYGWDSIHNYNYSLAKRIISYLDDINEHPYLQYVTLFGNALLVPPSYYIYLYWTPTDFFYTSPDYDLLPNFFVGRLPVNNTIEATHVVNKIKNWGATSELFKNVTISGGRTFSTTCFIGEMIATDSVNRGFFSGVDITKLLSTDGSFDKEHLIKALTGDTGILYHIDHGRGDAWKLENGPLTVEDVMSLPPCNKTPIVISIACWNGAYDTNLIDLGFEMSLGESIHLSDAGGIAYVGGSRPNYGGPIFNLDEGYVEISKEEYMAGMLTYVIKAYHDGGVTLGDLTSDAMITFLENNNFYNFINNYTLLSLVLLGDPALQIPDRPTGNEYQKPQSKAANPLENIDIESLIGPLKIGGTGEIPLGVPGEDLTIVSATNSPTVEIKVVDTLKEENVTVEKISKSTENNSVTYDFIPEKGKIYLIRTSTEDGKEGWMFVLSARLVDDDFDDSTPGWKFSRWAVIQDVVDYVDKNEIIIVYNGTYNENLIINKPMSLLGKWMNKTIIDGNGKGNVVTINGNGILICGFIIRNSGHSIATPYAGVYIDSGGNIVSGNTIINNKYGVFITEDHEEYNNIYCNNFIANTINAYDPSWWTWWSGLLNEVREIGNYWDDYKGKDQDNDGIGDTPYRIRPYSADNKDHFPLMEPYGDITINNQNSQQSNPQSSSPRQSISTLFYSFLDRLLSLPVFNRILNLH